MRSSCSQDSFAQLVVGFPPCQQWIRHYDSEKNLACQTFRHGVSSLNQGETGKEGQDRVWAFYRRQDNSADIDSKVERIVVKDGEVLEKNRPGERREQSLE